LFDSAARFIPTGRRRECWVQRLKGAGAVRVLLIDFDQDGGLPWGEIGPQ